MTLFARLNSARYSMLLAGLGWVVVLAVVATIGARWFWQLTAAPVQLGQHVSIADPIQAAGEISSRHLFGLSSSQAASANAPPPSRFKLIGLATGTANSPGFAILQEGENASISVLEGEEFLPGLKLVKIRPQSVEISRDGATETLILAGAEPVVSNDAVSAPPPPRSENIAPAQNRAEREAAMRN